MFLSELIALGENQKQYNLDSVVRPASDFLLRPVARLIHRRALGAEAVGGDRFGRSMRLQRLLMKVNAAILSRVLVTSLSRSSPY
ncbi:hypothetical protein ACFOPP_03645 [Sphingobium sp. GCM10012300]|uniref:hypothetical protein n=1 Tax=Sphingobium TaxID=165695 RepID=UPI001FF6CE69|nr:hypothetical protein [Sphingobium agri]